MFSIPFSLDRSMIINQPVSEVFATVANFNTWKTWSPWLIQEPSCPVEIKNDPASIGHGQSWDGQQIGSGNMALINIEPNKQLDYDLFFLKPWKSQSKTSFIFEEVGGQTKITWTMQGTLPFFLFWMKKMMGAWVGSDYVRGLTMLKDLSENGEVHSELNINDNQKQDAFFYVGIRRECSLEEMGEKMSRDLTSLHDKIENGELPQAKKVIGIYEKFDMVNSRCQFVSALTYDNAPSISDSKLTTGSYDSHNSCVVEHTGDYKHLGNAWSTGMAYLRYKKIKQAKKIFPYEEYVNDPISVASKDLITKVHFPLK